MDTVNFLKENGWMPDVYKVDLLNRFKEQIMNEYYTSEDIKEIINEKDVLIMDLEYGSYGDHDFHYCTIDDGELIISFNGCAHKCGWVEIQDLEVTDKDGQITYEI